jgi:NitT/TauT family transport system substrate-binding protein
MFEAGVVIALRRGYFAAECVRMEGTHFGNAIQMIPPLSQNQLDVGTGGPGAAFFNAVAREAGMRVVGSLSNADPSPESGSVIVIRSDLWDQGKHSLTDIKGETIALVGLNSSQHINLEAYIEPALGMKPPDLNKVVLPFPEMVLALKNKSIAAAMVVEPALSQILNQDLAKVVMATGKYKPNGQSSLLVYGPDMAQRRGAGNGFMVAYMKGVRDYVNAFKKGKDKAAIVQALVDAKILGRPRNCVTRPFR